MGLLDRVKQNQIVPPAGSTGNGPAIATLPGAPTYTPQAAIPVAQPAAPATPGPASPSRSPVGGDLSPAFTAAKVQIHAKLIEKFADEIDSSNKPGVREKILELAEDYFRSTAMTMTKNDKERLVDSVLDDVLGLGPLEALLADPNITEIMANHPKQIYVEKSGEPILSSVTFESERQMRQVIDRIVSLVGRRVDESTPICDARLKDGSRVNVVIPPIALKGPALTIRKFAKEKWGPADIVNRFKSSSPEIMTFLRSCVRARLNILVSGGTGSGKTTLLNILSSFIPENERLITCEDAAELQLQQPHWIQLESRPPNVEGKGAVPIRELVKSCLRMRPDRIIVGECRGGEALDMLQAMNTGHDGSMSTLHANNPKEALVRLETLVLQAGQDLPSRAIRETIGSAIHLIVQQSRLRGGIRRIVSVAEITGIKDGEVQFQEIFRFNQLGVNQEGKAVGYHTASIAAQGLALALLAALVFSSDRPFKGNISVSPAPIVKVLAAMNART